MSTAADNHVQINDLERQVFDLTSLLTAGRAMHNILVPSELYAVLVAMVAEKLEAGPMALFCYDAGERSVRLVHTYQLPDVLDDELRFFFEEGLLWQNVLQYEPFPVTSASGKPLFERFFAKNNLSRFKADLWIPLFLKDKLIGLLTMGNRPNGRPYDKHEMDFIKQFAPTAASSINMCHLYVQRNEEKEELTRTFRNLSLLYDIGRAMTLISDLKQLLGYILEQATTVAASKKGSIMLYDQEKNVLEMRMIEGLDSKALQERINNYEVECRTFAPGEGVAGKVFASGEPLILNSTSDNEQFVSAGTSYVDSIACVPMKVNGDVIGVINVTNKRDGSDFTKEDINLLAAIADQAAIAINKAQLWELSVTDSLTGLYLRRYALARFNNELIRARRFEHCISVAMCDVDHFKQVNDNHGHEAGDIVLKTIAEMFKETARAADCVARYGGEEFIFLLVETDKFAAAQAAERLRDMIEAREMPNGLRVTLSIGLSTYPDDGDEIEDLIRKADEALYRAKAEGRSRVVSYIPNVQKRAT
ncbi:MAG: diguanylate cyclase [Verrucomicrobia bacterium]|nr:diguanylate cyclase [Verrucomicrobiota bacterium]